MDLLIEKNDGSKAFISQFKVLVTEFEESAPVVKRNNTELDQRNGAIDFGGWHDSKEIKLTAIYKADGMDEEERLREKIYALLSDPDGYYITQFKTSPLEALQRPGETTGDYFEQLTDYPSHKRFNVYASEIENEFQGRIGGELLYKLSVTFKTLWLPYGETPARDVVLNENKANAVGTNLLINSVAIKYIGTVPCNQLEQGFRIRFTAIQEADHLDLSMNGETVTYSDTVHSGDVFEFAGSSYRLNELSVTNKVTKNYYTLKPNGENILSCNITGKFEILKFQNLYA